MEKMILMSVRLDPEVVAMLEDVVKRNKYWKRNAVINTLLQCVLQYADQDSIYKMLSHRWLARAKSAPKVSFYYDEP